MAEYYGKCVSLQLPKRHWAKVAKRYGGYDKYIGSLPFDSELAATNILFGDKKFLAKVTAAVAAQWQCEEEKVTLTLRRTATSGNYALVASLRAAGVYETAWLFHIYQRVYSQSLAIGIVSIPLNQSARAASFQFDVFIGGISTLAQAVVIAKRELLAVIDSWNAQPKATPAAQFNDAEDML